MKQDRISNR